MTTPWFPLHRFRIDSSTGTIYVAAALDREETDDYYLTAEARDGGGLRTPTEVTIGVLDVNDNAPQFRRKDYEATVREGDSDFLRPLIVEVITYTLSKLKYCHLPKVI